MSRLSRTLFVAATLSAVAACGHKPPYGVGGAPETELLLEKTAPQLDAVAVPDATITLNRVVRADLAMLAQVDARFRGSVTKAGNEVVTLAFSEEGYGLRYKLDEIPTGFYSGPADPCAVKAMLGVPFTYEGLVSLVLGGAPVIEGGQVVKQKWNRKGGFETVTLDGGGYVQELRFAWVGGAWVFAGGQMWQGSADAKGQWLWTLEHDKHRKVGDAMLPGRTKVRAPVPGKRRDTLVIISYKDRVANPPWSKTQASGGDGGDSGPDSGGDDGGWESGDDGGGWENSDDGGDDGGWENSEDAGWENEVPSAEPSPDTVEPIEQTSPPPPSGVLASVLNRGAQPAAAEPAPVPAKSAVPPVFRIEAAGLPDRGDLCR